MIMTVIDDDDDDADDVMTATKDLESEDSWKWVTKGVFKRETESPLLLKIKL